MRGIRVLGLEGIVRIFRRYPKSSGKLLQCLKKSMGCLNDYFIIIALVSVYGE